MYVGFRLKQMSFIKNIKLISKIKTLITVAVCLILLVLSNQFNDITWVDFDGNQYGNILLMYLGAFSGIYLVSLTSVWLSDSKALAYFGNNTLPIFGFNYAVITVLGYIFFLSNIQANLIIYFVLQLIIYPIIIVVISKIPFLSNLINGQSITVKHRIN